MGLHVVSSGGNNRHIVVQNFAPRSRVVKNKNTGQSFRVVGKNDSVLELEPMQGSEVLVNVGDFTSESWEIIH